LHGGEVHAESPGPGAGATFTIALPGISPHASDQATEPAGLSLSGPDVNPPTLSGISILVVDDHGPTREAVAETLEREGARIAVAASAEQGRTCLDGAAFDLIISDLSMPEEDGYTFIRGVRRSQGAARSARPLRALAMTAQAAPRQLEQALEAGFDQCLVKPVERQRLLSAVADLVCPPARALSGRLATR
jgi:CheY-like chemotaxis protein